MRAITFAINNRSSRHFSTRMYSEIMCLCLLSFCACKSQDARAFKFAK